ncbi:unnamed protein product [Cuscuta europaea]|uniref:LOB domain-containing protein n=1 Tax=Cuscuta europaea TaxID=41803 RepID=A0A9P0YLW6_CUSEU|nr:unnamed protein product [Cuscuta europaea]
MSSSSNSNPPCAACKFLRRKCLPGCVFSPYFPPEEPQKFVNVHKIFGASNVSKLLSEIQPHQREDAVNSLAYEAEARLKDPVYGCVGAISVLQTQVLRLQKELEATNADLMRFASSNSSNNAAEIMSTSSSGGYSPVGKPAAAAGSSLNGHGSLSFNLQRMTMAGGGHPHNMAMMMQLQQQQQNGRSRMTEGGDGGGGGLQLHNYAQSQGMTTTDYYYSSAWSNSSSGGEHNSDGADNGDCSM